MSLNVRRHGLESLEGRAMLSSAPMLLDANTFGVDTLIEEMTEVNGSVYFRASDLTHGQSLWKSDGTESGTIVLDLKPGPQDAHLDDLVNFNGVLFFNGPDRELWKSDGTLAGTVRVKDLVPGNGNSSPQRFTVGGGLLFFYAFEAATGYEPWVSDGTEAGTIPLGDLSPGPQSSMPAFFSPGLQTSVGSTFYFVANNGAHGDELWRSDGTTAGTSLVKDVYSGAISSRPENLINVNGTLFFSANDGATGAELWKVGPGDNDATLVKDIRAGSSSSGPARMVAVGNLLYFEALTTLHGRELWRSDGTEVGTYIVHDVRPGYGSSTPRYMTNVNGTLYFAAADDPHGVEIWKSDGTAAGTQLLQDFYPGGTGSTPRELINVNGTLFFALSRDAGGELWRSDGTLAGTSFVRSFPDYPDFPEATVTPGNLLAAGGNVFFLAAEISEGRELWVTDGTTVGTHRVKDVNPQNKSSYSSYLTNVNGKLYFSVYDEHHGSEPWTSDGTVVGTRRLKDIYPGESSSGPHAFYNFAGNVVFSIDNSPGLWTSDGSEAGTQDLADVYVDEWATLGDVAFFSGWTSGLGNELWRTDGTREGTLLVKDLTLGVTGSQISQLTVVGEYLYFVANGRQLWRTDGSAAGTTMMRDFVISPGPQELINVGGTLYFTAQTPELSWSLWRSDGTTLGTLAIWSGNVHGLVNLHDELYFGIDDQLWKKIDEEDGAVLVKDANPDSSLEELYEMTIAGGAIFFAANDGTNGYELWKSDGTAEGTVLVRDLRDGPESSHPQQFTSVGGVVYFTAIDDFHGAELWRTDGTLEGTELVADLLAGTGSSYPNNLTNVSGDLFFVANDQTHGFEPWVIRGPQHADYDDDGRVDGSDFLAWQRSFGSTATPAGSGADGNGNGTVESGDLAVWKAGFGAGGEAPLVATAAGAFANELSVASLRASEETSTPDGDVSSDGAAFDHAADAAFAWLAGDRTVTVRDSWKHSAAVEVELLARAQAARSSLVPSARMELGGSWGTGASIRRIGTATVSLGAGDALAEGEGLLAAELGGLAAGSAFPAEMPQ